MALHISGKHAELNKAQTTMLGVVAASVVIVIFCLFGIKAMISKGAYQQRVLTAKNQAVKQLESNYTAAQALAKAYQNFASADPNILGGNVAGSGGTDGNNAQIVLDALPSTYDAPALASTVEKILSNHGVDIQSISVTDDSASNPNTSVAKPSSVVMSFSLSGTSDYNTDQKVMQDFEKSIRPFDVSTLELSGSDGQLQMTLTMNSYYQQSQAVNLSVKKVVK